jgi:hypothetical protein
MIGVVCVVYYPVVEREEPVQIWIWYPTQEAADFAREQDYEDVGARVDAVLTKMGYELEESGETGREIQGVNRDDPRVHIVGGV